MPSRFAEKKIGKKTTHIEDGDKDGWKLAGRPSHEGFHGNDGRHDGGDGRVSPSLLTHESRVSEGSEPPSLFAPYVVRSDDFFYWRVHFLAKAPSEKPCVGSSAT